MNTWVYNWEHNADNKYESKCINLDGFNNINIDTCLNDVLELSEINEKELMKQSYTILKMQKDMTKMKKQLEIVNNRLLLLEEDNIDKDDTIED